MTTHSLKVAPPYFDALLTEDKTFEVRRNDRGFQRADVLRLAEWDEDRMRSASLCDGPDYGYTGRVIHRTVTYVYTGDPRFGGIEQGFVVLGLAVRFEPGDTGVEG